MINFNLGNYLIMIILVITINLLILTFFKYFISCDLL